MKNMQRTKCVILLVAGIFIGMGIEKLLSFRTEFAISVWSSRDNLHLARSYMQELADDCDVEEYEVLSASHKYEIEYFGDKVENITKFPHFGSEQIQEMLETEYSFFIENHKKMNEEISKCKGT